MADTSGVLSTLRRFRLAADLSQQILADRAGATRQAINAIERGHQVPSTGLALRLARELGCRVEDLFSLDDGALGLRVTLAGDASAPTGAAAGTARVVVARIGERWVAHRVGSERAEADGVLLDERSPHRSQLASEATVEPLVDRARLERHVLVGGCAPLLGPLAHRVGLGGPARATWLHAPSRRALDLLDAGLLHVAGIHFVDAAAGITNESEVRARFPGRRMVLASLTRWRQGLIVAPANPLGIGGVEDLRRPGLRVALREPGAGAAAVLGASDHDPVGGLKGPLAAGHVDVARLIRCGAADVGVAIEAVAIAAGLDFIPLTEERFDLVVDADQAEQPACAQLLSALDDPRFRREVATLPGYDATGAGHVSVVHSPGGATGDRS